MKDREFGRGRIMAEVIAERSFAPAFFGGTYPFEDKFRICRNGDRDRTSSDKLRAFFAEEPGEKCFVNPFRQRRNCCEEHCRVGAERDGEFERLVHFVRLIVMEAAAFLNLPVHAGRPGVEHLHPVHADVSFAVPRVMGEHLRQSDEPPAILRPALDDRQVVQVGILDDFLGRSDHDVARP